MALGEKVGGAMELRDYLRGLRRHWLAVVLMTILGVLVAFGWTLIQTPVYSATANGLIQSVESAEEGSIVSNEGFAKSKVPTYLDMATWREVAEHAIDATGSSATPEQIASRVTVVNPDGTAILKVTALAGSPADAAALAAGVDRRARSEHRPGRRRRHCRVGSRHDLLRSRSDRLEHPDLPRHDDRADRRRCPRTRRRHRFRARSHRIRSSHPRRR